MITDTHTTPIALSKLTAWDGNVRRTGSNEGIGELVASIAAHGLLQSLVVKKAPRGKFAVVAGQRRLLALKELAAQGRIEADAAVACRVIAATADATELSLAENAVRLPMHPADQFEAFRDLIDWGSSPADVAARFGVNEATVKKRLRLARVSPVILAAYREGSLGLEQVMAFAVSDDAHAQEQVFAQLPPWEADPSDIRATLTQDEIAATDRRVRFVTLAAYEEAGGRVKRDLFAENEDGVFILDTSLLDALVTRKLEAEARTLRAEGWKWVEARASLDYEARSGFRRLHPEPVALGDEEQAELDRLAQEYDTLAERAEEDEEASARLDEIQERIDALERRERAYTLETLSIAGAIVTLGSDGRTDIVRGLVRPEDAPAEKSGGEASGPKVRPMHSAALVESLTAAKSAALGAELARRPDTALAVVVHALALSAFRLYGESSLQLSLTPTHYREGGSGCEALTQARAAWGERMPGEAEALWQWCLAQDRDTLLELLAFCAGCSIDAVQKKHERPDNRRLAHAQAVGEALKFDMTAWFSPTAANYFNRVSHAVILGALAQAKGAKPMRSWQAMKKSELAALAEREVAGTGWLPQPLKG